MTINNNNALCVSKQLGKDFSFSYPKEVFEVTHMLITLIWLSYNAAYYYCAPQIRMYNYASIWKDRFFFKNTDKYTIAKERWKIPVTWVFWSPHRNRATEAWRPHLVSSNQLDFRMHFSLSLHRCRVHRFQENMIEMSVPVPQDDSHLHLKFSLMWWKTNCNY